MQAVCAVRAPRSSLPPHPVGENADRLVRNLDEVAVLQRRLGRPVAAEPDDVVGPQRDVARHARDVARHAEDHAPGVVARYRAAVDAHLDHLVHGIDAGDDPRPHGLEGVGAFRAPQRAVGLLPGALADIVAERVAAHAVERALLRHVPRLLADHRDQLALVLDRPGRVRRDNDVVAAADQRARRAVADVGLRRDLVARAAAVGPLDVREVVEPRGVEVARDDRRGKLGEGHAPPPPTTRLRPAFLAAYRASSACFIQESDDSPGRSSLTPMLTVTCRPSSRGASATEARSCSATAMAAASCASGRSSMNSSPPTLKRESTLRERFPTTATMPFSTLSPLAWPN